MKWTIIGAGGFIGSYLFSHLQRKGNEVIAVYRSDDLEQDNLGHVIYCAGLTADFRTRPYDTIDAHVKLPSDILKGSIFESFLYLSSTRVYQRCHSTNESIPITVLPEDPSDLYNLSKLMGESICLVNSSKKVRIARLSNILGFFPGNINFVDSLLAEAFCEGAINISTASNSAKDYLFIDEAVLLIEKIILHGTERIYNVASGVNLSNLELAQMIEEKIGCMVKFKEGAPAMLFPPIDTGRIVKEFSFKPSDFKENLFKLIDEYSAQIIKAECSANSPTK